MLPLAMSRALGSLCSGVTRGSLVEKNPQRLQQHGSPRLAAPLRGARGDVGPVMAQVAAHAAASFSWHCSSQLPSDSKGQTQGHRPAHDLSWQPTLSTWEELLVLALSGLLCSCLHLVLVPVRVSLSYLTCVAVLYGCLAWFMRFTLMEQQYQARARAFSELGDHDSSFTRLDELTVHCKASISPCVRPQLSRQLQTTKRSSSEPSKPACSKRGSAPVSNRSVGQPAEQLVPFEVHIPELVAAHCYHGFGANLNSFAPVQAKLAEALNGVVTSHDMPGFGLTERPCNVASYFLSYNVRLGVHVMVHAVQNLLRDVALKAIPLASAKAGTACSSPRESQQQGTEVAWQKALLVKAHPLSGQGDWEAEDAADGMQQQTGNTASGLQRAASPLSVLQSDDSGLLSCSESITASHPPLSLCSSDGSSQCPHEQSLQQAQVLSTDSGKFMAGAVASLCVKKVLIGHSMGSICAALQALQQPDAVSALVLVSPAIVALPDASTPQYGLQAIAQYHDCTALEFPDKLVARLACDSGSLPDQGEATDSRTTNKQPFKGRLAKVLKAMLRAGLLLMTLAVLNVMRPVIVVLLRILVRSRNFWLKGLQQAYYDPSQVTDNVVDAYRLPQLVQGWEAGMFMFLTARLVHTTDWQALASHLAAGLWSASPGLEQQVAAEELGLAHRLALLAQQHGTPVLIIHGYYDKLVPCSNSRRLAAMLPGCELAVMKRCGHMPQEEWPDLFVQLVQDFVHRRTTGSNKGQVLTIS